MTISELQQQLDVEEAAEQARAVQNFKLLMRGYNEGTPAWRQRVLDKLPTRRLPGLEDWRAALEAVRAEL